MTKQVKASLAFSTHSPWKSYVKLICQQVTIQTGTNNVINNRTRTETNPTADLSDFF